MGGPFCFGLAHLEGVDVEATQRAFRALSPPLDESVPRYVGRARQQLAFGLAAVAAGAPLDYDTAVDIAHYLNPDGLGAWEDMGTLRDAFVRFAAWAEERYS